MKLHTAAKHLASQGRGPDTMLVHMAPSEVAGLHALAAAHGTTLTTNPTTGLPEAFSLSDIMPAVAGFALDAFLPGAGEAVGGMMGLSGAAGSAAIVGGLAGLSSGSLSQGIMAGMGAYGGAGLASGMLNSGTSALTQQGVSAANDAATAAGLTPGSDEYTKFFQDQRNSTSPMDTMGKLKAGASAAMAAPKDFLKDNFGNLAMAAGPAMAGMMQPNTAGVPANSTSPGYIRKYAKDPVTGALYQTSATPTADFGSQSAVTFGGVPQSTHYASGGLAHVAWNPDTKSYDTVSSSGVTTPAATGPVTFGGVRQSTHAVDANDTRTDSQKAYDYLMGVPGAKNPMLFTHVQPDKFAITPLDMNTRTGGHYTYNTDSGQYDWTADTAAPSNASNAASLDAAPIQPGTGTSGDSSASSNDSGLGLASLGMSGISGLAGAFGIGTAPGVPGGAPVSDMSTLSPAAQAEAEAAAQNAADNATAMNSMGEALAADSAGSNAAAAAAAAAAGPTSAAGENGSPSTSTGDSVGDGGGNSVGDGGVGVGDAIGGFYHKGKFNFHPDQIYAQGGIAALAGGGLGSLGGYSDGGQLLKGPGDGVSDDIPATIGHGQPARLANNEFVIPARIVSELGNGSTDAGAKQLYAMMARIQAGRKKTMGKNNVAVDSKAVKHLPA